MTWPFLVRAPLLQSLALRVALCSVLLTGPNACSEQDALREPDPTARVPGGKDASSATLDARTEPPRADGSADARSSPLIDASSATGAGVSEAGSAGSAAHDAGLTDTGPTTTVAIDGAAPSAERSTDFAVGTRRIEITSGAGRVLPVQLWYPAVDGAAAEAEAGHAIEEFEAKGARRDLLAKLVQDARKDCPNLTMHAAIEATPYAHSAPFPLLVYSHHFNGSRFSMFSIAEALAREGMVVAAPDHVNGSLFERKDALSDAASQFNREFLQTRAADLRRLLDVLLDTQAELVPAGLRGRLDAQRVGALGHSLGGITVGVFSVSDTRVRASLYLAIVPSPALLRLPFGLPDPKQFRTPALYLTAQEDATVDGQGGPAELATNYEGQPLPAFWIDVRDAGHFSFADDCGLVPEFDEGCGTGRRVTNGESFTYLPAKRAQEIAARYSTAFFAVQFLGAPATRLTEPSPPELITVKQRGASAPGP